MAGVKEARTARASVTGQRRLRAEVLVLGKVRPVEIRERQTTRPRRLAAAVQTSFVDVHRVPVTAGAAWPAAASAVARLPRMSGQRLWAPRHAERRRRRRRRDDIERRTRRRRRLTTTTAATTAVDRADECRGLCRRALCVLTYCMVYRADEVATRLLRTVNHSDTSIKSCASTLMTSNQCSCLQL